MNAAISPALALPELPAKLIEQGWHDTFSTSNPFCPCTLKTFQKSVGWAHRHYAKAALTYGQQCAQAQGEAQAAEIKRLKALLERCKEWHQGDKWRDGNPDKRQAWEAHMRALDAALKSEAA